MIRLSQLKTTLVIVALTAGAHSAAAQTPKAPPAATDDTREVNMRAYTELLRSDIRGQTSAIITEVMQFTEAEDAKFWPIYREFEAELAKINGERIALITDYADHYSALTDEVADKLARRALDLEARRQALKATYYDKIKAALSSKTAARFIQVENQILLLLDLQIAASLPLARN
jgi:hypothetical protein